MNDEAALSLQLTDADGRVLRRLPMERSITVGRSTENDLVIVDPRVSKQHACLSRGAKSARVRDLGSRNGTRVNDVPIPPEEDVEVAVGDVIQFGSHEVALLVGSQLGAPEENGDTQLLAFDDLAASLNAEQSDMVADLAANDSVEPPVQQFCLRYVAAPLPLIRRQNQTAFQRLGGDEDTVPEDIPIDTLDNLRSLNARVERLIYPERAERHEINTLYYEELEDVEFIVHGDLFPSHLSMLDDPSSFDYRELLIAHKMHTELAELLREARALGIAWAPAIARGNVWDAAKRVFTVCHRLYSPEQESRIHAGKVKTLGFFARHGGSCRHRGATLQLMMQEAGIRSRYVRGVLLGSGPHAWVEVSSGEDDGFAWLMDPNFGVCGAKGEVKPLGKVGGKPFDCFPLLDALAIGTQRPDELVYGRVEGPFNAVWRPRRRDGLGM